MTRPSRLLRVPVVCAALGLAATACGGASSDASRQEPSLLRVATTVAPITSIVANVAGDRAQVTGIVPEGSNSHTFDPPPSVARTLSRADVVIANGLKLEEPTIRLARANLREGASVVLLGDDVLPEAEWIFDFSFPRDGGKPNPHLWTSPALALRYTARIGEALSQADPERADHYASRANAYSGKLRSLDAALREASATIEPGARKLLTYHDAYAYFAREYGWEVVGAIQPSDFTEPSPREVARLITQIREERVSAVFGSEVFPSPVLERIAAETGARYVDELRDDDLPGRPGEPEHSFLALLQFNFVTLVEALGGDAAVLRAVDTSDLDADTAEYPQ